MTTATTTTADKAATTIHSANGQRPLATHHLAMLREGSGISEEVIAARGYFTIESKDEARKLGFSEAQCIVPSLVLPLHATDGSVPHYILRPDNPRVFENRRKGKLADGTYPQRVLKYEQPKGEGVRVDCPPASRPQLANPEIPLFITEGQKKADALVSRGACAIALTGVWNWKAQNSYGGITFTNDLDYVAWGGRPVYWIPDSDVSNNPHVKLASKRFIEHLQRKGAQVSIIYLPKLEGGKTGVDDWLVATGKTLDDLLQLAEGPRPEMKAAEPMIELLDVAPNRMSRPLALVGGRAYAAAWAWVQVTVTESVNRHGEIVRHDPPQVSTEQRMFVVRDDGVIFGPGGHKPLAELELDVRLAEVPQRDLLLSTPALKKYVSGYRPRAVDVFERMVDAVDRFIDFDRSLAPQRVMAELIACYALATWFLDAFTVAGNMWPNGERGSGKTQLLLVVAGMSYLGQVVLAGGSFAALRDMADYGASLFFDDAENITDPRKTDPDKRTLLLAGNRRGNTVALKEAQGNGQWVTRHVDTFSFRGFSAIRLPDNVLASRTIIIPLIRTPDRYRANADPSDYGLWPHPRREIVDDCWLLALAHLPEMQAFERRVNDEARLSGRNLEPWRALLAVAMWLDAQGAQGLWERMEQLSIDYQSERPTLEMSDLTSIVIRALMDCAISANNADCAINRERPFTFATKQITDAAQKIIEEHELDIDADYVTSRRVGRVLGKMRFKNVREKGSDPRGWRMTRGDIEKWAASYGILTDWEKERQPVADSRPIPSQVPLITPLSINGTNGTDGPNGTNENEIDLIEGAL